MSLIDGYYRKVGQLLTMLMDGSLKEEIKYLQLKFGG
jgi:hypothetical protein